MLRVADSQLEVLGVGSSPTGAGNLSGGACWCKDRAPVATYGVWEVRARFDAGAGYAPVMGLWPADNDNAGWLTILESDPPRRNSFHPTVRGSDGQSTLGTDTTLDLTGWHTHKLEWRADFVRVYADDKVVFDTRTSSAKVAIPSEQMYFYVQQRIGPDGGTSAANADTPSQVVTHLDWVRYQP